MGSIVGNERLRQKLCLDILAGRLAHAFIIEGKRGTGKHTLALNTAAALACSAKDATDSDVPCGTCPECKKIFEGKSPDIITVGCEGKTTLGVDAVRFLKEDVHTVPNDLDFKLYIIEDADKMTVQAQNALLLTLDQGKVFPRGRFKNKHQDAVDKGAYCKLNEGKSHTVQALDNTFDTQDVNGKTKGAD